MIGWKLSNFGVLHEVGLFLKSAHIFFLYVSSEESANDWVTLLHCLSPKETHTQKALLHRVHLINTNHTEIILELTCRLSWGLKQSQFGWYPPLCGAFHGRLWGSCSQQWLKNVVEVIMGHGPNWQVGEHSGFQNKMKRTGKQWWHSESGMFLTVLDSNDQTPCTKLKCIPVRSSITLSVCHGLSKLIVRQYGCSLTETDGCLAGCFKLLHARERNLMEDRMDVRSWLWL